MPRVTNGWILCYSHRMGDTGKLLGLSAGYFVSYLLTGVFVKVFTGSPSQGFLGMNSVEYLVYSTLASNAFCLVLIAVLGWYRFPKEARVDQPLQLGPWLLPGELRYLFASGLCTAVIVPATTLMYLLPISVMVAMVIMRGSIIVVSRLVDAIQIRQGYLKKRVGWQENVAVGFSLLAVGTKLFYVDPAHADTHFAFLSSTPAMVILCGYIIAYAIRIYLMNYFKNTRPHGAVSANRAFFAWEQTFCSIAIVGVAAALFYFGAPVPGEIVATTTASAASKSLQLFHDAFANPNLAWGKAAWSGLPYGWVAFFSVFLFMFKGRSATFNGLVNRLTSLLAGTASTLFLAWQFGLAMPAKEDWLSLFFVCVSIAFLTFAELHHKKGT